MDPRHHRPRRQAFGHPGDRGYPDYPPASRRDHGAGPRGQDIHLGSDLDSLDSRLYRSDDGYSDSEFDFEPVHPRGFDSENSDEEIARQEFPSSGPRRPRRAGGAHPGRSMHGGHPGHHGPIMDPRGGGRRYPGDLIDNPTRPVGPGYPPRRGHGPHGGPPPPHAGPRGGDPRQFTGFDSDSEDSIDILYANPTASGRLRRTSSGNSRRGAGAHGPPPPAHHGGPRRGGAGRRPSDGMYGPDSDSDSEGDFFEDERADPRMGGFRGGRGGGAQRGGRRGGQGGGYRAAPPGYPW
ncbi:MAG: hypothetical protein Q9208_008191 [Pyrenodesmia sp. 3 TL-2023]